MSNNNKHTITEINTHLPRGIDRFLPYTAKRILDDMITMYYESKPANEDFLYRNEELRVEMHYIEREFEDDNISIAQKLQTLYNFNVEWFPNHKEAKSKAVYTKLLDEVNNISKMFQVGTIKRG